MPESKPSSSSSSAAASKQPGGEKGSRQRSGSRRTQQRTAIREALVRTGRPLSPQEVLEVAQEDVPSLGIATVYRNLRFLVDEGVIKTVDLPGSGSRFEVADLAHHHHFHCQNCDRVFDLHSCPGDLGNLVPDGYVLESHEIILYGSCPSCPPATE
ncbi:MAG: transcriptional repressor [Acidobacteriota bacterium]